jgi:hypothetical protein
MSTNIQFNDCKAFVERNGTAHLHFLLNQNNLRSEPLKLNFSPDMWEKLKAAVNAPSQEK